MIDFQIETARLILVAANPALLQKALEDEKELATALNVQLADHWTIFGKGVFEYVLQQQLEEEQNQYWWTYFILHKQDQILIGTGGYKGPPNVENQVEIGYEIAEKYQGRGLATEAAQGFIDHAFQLKEVQGVKAHTLAFENPSTSVLRKCGMQQTGTIEDPEDGTIWSWLLQKK